MIDITSKISTLRVATAQAVVCVSQQLTIDAIANKTVPKGDVFEMSKAAGLLGVKKTPELLPDCHPMPIEFTGIHYEIKGLEIYINVTVKTIYKTGVEVEAMHGASIVALNLYDMLKPIDKGIEIRNIKLINKKGGKSDFTDKHRKDITAAVIVCSDTIVTGAKEDKAGKVIMSKLESIGIEIKAFEVIADEPEDIRNVFLSFVQDKIDLVIFCGGTGLSKRDVTPETIAPLLDREIPGIAEAMRNYGQQRTPYSMLSRSLSGVKDQTMVLALPGSTKGASESMDALFPPLLHAFRIFKGARHD
ncbi:MAG: bifunctional molybdenum cofactor biosynthesis protein MoaC/MoaB [Crocinitomicaceae bacterium]|jgi:molybdenum cofactor biosynthesis protein MoaC|nr:bifunctional molybdenum cofactor biosynthesis protein MoaC/MoaB [Crocinitomicaceae bacterium]MBT5404170.1 bifunctional molybdenum cofactor biosynthesis protein MoaC/MoaB [Crocinitomicaceae bacterium]MBT6030808.1 bifunctional molybdenum cofactor biosynthesis protein MoaC/MoaB [Crocinitomicaceae bacterium]MBT6515063.1 bifunctional molybdenum cofactor biosynthesis protein MoaC/MoaB [Crocinitomicaceae bacterium]MDG2330125.1 bifunctional molybdenum cofactor biosynthesis protein MoaC/MoaB [Flavoba